LRETSAEECYDHVSSDGEITIVDGRRMNVQTKKSGIIAKVGMKTK
jgi:hypothetical protein